ncbi:inositol monophosphatase family protein [Paracoccus denitrificans]|uniref:inositol monophosphatase family protein n=1 Tax=Paracoccus denitrificans TaxID=266 RepID=UPI000CEC8212|nr:inositol monophosphatase [Paracoccus denitrificans]
MNLMTPTDLDAEIAATARAAALAAGAIAREAFLNATPADLATEQKAGFFDIVTVTDKAAEVEASRIIWDRLPQSRILGEESGWQGAGPASWIIDPIDGTSNFASGLPFFSVSIAAYYEGRPVCAAIYDPIRDELFMAESGRLTLNGAPVALYAKGLADREVELLTNAPYEGARPTPETLAGFADVVDSFRAVRRLGSCALHLAYVAAGRVAVCYESKFSAWDIAAGLQLVQAAGGIVHARDAEGAPIGTGHDDLSRVRRLVVAQKGFDYSGSCLSKLMDHGAL